MRLICKLLGCETVYTPHLGFLCRHRCIHCGFECEVQAPRTWLGNLIDFLP